MSNFDQTDQHSDPKSVKNEQFLEFFLTISWQESCLDLSCLVNFEILKFLTCLEPKFLITWKSWIVLTAIWLSWVVLSRDSRFCLCLELSCLEKFLSWPIPAILYESHCTFSPCATVILRLPFSNIRVCLCSVWLISRKIILCLSWKKGPSSGNISCSWFGDF